MTYETILKISKNLNARYESEYAAWKLLNDEKIALVKNATRCRDMYQSYFDKRLERNRRDDSPLWREQNKLSAAVYIFNYVVAEADHVGRLNVTEFVKRDASLFEYAKKRGFFRILRESYRLVKSESF